MSWSYDMINLTCHIVNTRSTLLAPMIDCHQPPHIITRCMLNHHLLYIATETNSVLLPGPGVDCRQ